MTAAKKKNTNKTGKSDRGRTASRPSNIPRKGWRDILLRVRDEQSKDNLSLVSAGMAFYAFLAVFPALAAIVSIYGLVSDPQTVQQQINAMSGIMPEQAYKLIENQLTSIVQQSGGALGIGVFVGILLTIWSANKGMQALITSLNIVYDEEENRSFLELNGLSLLFTLCAVVLVVIAIVLIVGVPAVIGRLGFPPTIQYLFTYLRWPLLAVFVVFGLGLAYRYCPDRDAPKARWVSWGSILATVVWIVASVLFSYYVSNFGSYNKTYGSMGAVVVLMMWFFLTSYIVLLGAELNAEMEHQTSKDTTRGKSKPIGKRDAYVADTVGERKEKR